MTRTKSVAPLTAVVRKRGLRAADPTKSNPKKERGKVAAPVSDDEDVDGGEESAGSSDAYEEEDARSLHSDALDDDDDFEEEAKVGKKRKRTSRSSPKRASLKASSPKKAAATKQKRKKKAESDEEDEPEGDGCEVVGAIVQAPKTGRVPPGQISQNTLDFLTKLKDPACNDREWFKLHEPVYRFAEQEFKYFISAFTDALAEADPQVPPLPPKDLIHRIYRDIRFSNDKTPYKRGFSASFSRSGRKGIFAGYHVLIKPGGESLIAAGSWWPGKNELAMIRSHILASPARLRAVLAEPAFVRLFGPPHPHARGERQNVFGMEDELKVAPKGVDKNHPDIDLLKCRSFAVSHKFTDVQIRAPDFVQELARVAEIVRPLVHCLNDMMTLPVDEDEEENGGSDEE